MPYKALLVDDERPALNYINAIFKNCIEGFEVCGTAEDAAEALQFMKKQQIDLLITDISFPGDMNGVDLAKKVRQLYPAVSIVVLSAHAEFEYARGALQAGVDEYMLKPISPTELKTVLMKVKTKLDEKRVLERLQSFIALVSHRSVADDVLERCFGNEKYYMAVCHFGNLTQTRFSRAVVILPCPYQPDGWINFYGRDENELVMLLSEKKLKNGSFQDAVEAIVKSYAQDRFYTLVYDQNPQPVKSLFPFLVKAGPRSDISTVIGVSQILSLDTPEPKPVSPLSVSIRRQLVSLLDSQSWTAIQELFLSLAVSWEKERLPQFQVETLCEQLINLIIGENNPAVRKSIRQINEEASSVYELSSNIGELLSGLYAILFGDLSSHDKRISGEELCEYTLRYIRENYAQPLSIQSVCSKIGFSQTYLSRLLRRHADTTVNTYLTQCRIEAAKELLQKNPDALLRTVAASVGYDDQSYFIKIFRTETGLTPKQYAAPFLTANTEDTE